jgi:hypothetical protein
MARETAKPSLASEQEALASELERLGESALAVCKCTARWVRRIRINEPLTPKVMLKVLDTDLEPYGLTALTIRGAIKRRELPEIRLGKQVLGVRPTDLLAWIDSRTVVPNP